MRVVSGEHIINDMRKHKYQQHYEHNKRENAGMHKGGEYQAQETQAKKIFQLFHLRTLCSQVNSWCSAVKLRLYIIVRQMVLALCPTTFLKNLAFKAGVRGRPRI